MPLETGMLMADQPVNDMGTTFNEFQPPSRIRELVWSLWVQHVSAQSAPYSHRTVPDGGVHLVYPLGGGLHIRGPRTRPSVEILEPGVTIVGVRLWPGAASELLRVPGRDLRDAKVPMEDISGHWRMVSDRLSATRSPHEALGIVLDKLAMETANGVAPDPIVQRCVQWLRPGGSRSVGNVALYAGVSDRRLRRLFDVHVGLPPKVLQTVFRLQGVLADIQTVLVGSAASGDRVGLASLAARHGYFDQAHLTRDFRRLVGASPGGFVARTERECGRHHDHAAGFCPLSGAR